MDLYLRVKNTTDETLDVTSDHIKSMKEDIGITPVKYKNKDGEAEAPLLLLKLKKGQEVDMNLRARKGRGMEHAKWSPVATVAMAPVP